MRPNVLLKVLNTLTCNVILTNCFRKFENAFTRFGKNIKWIHIQK